MTLDLWTHLMTASPYPAPVLDLATWWGRHREASASLSSSIERAVVGGFAADRPGYAFASGYHEALRHLVPSLGPRPAALCATEEGGAHPRAIQAVLRPDGDGWRLSGAKSWITLGMEAQDLLIVASLGCEAEGAGRNHLAVVRVPADRPGLVREPLPPLTFVPEIGHARLRMADVEVQPQECLPGDGYEGYLKPFRTIEDCHVHGALLGWLVQVGRRAGWPHSFLQQMLLHIAALCSLGQAPPLGTGVHLALGGLLDAMPQLLGEMEPHWQQVDEETRLRWARDRPLLAVAGRARSQRLEAAWQALATAPPAAAGPAHVLPTREGYDRWAALYDEEDNPLVKLEAQHLPPLLGEIQGWVVADIGCGTGRHAVALAQAGAQVTALDFSQGMLARARDKAGPLPVRFLLHDVAQPLPLADGSFDLVLSCLVLEHLVDLHRFFAELARICRPEGAVVISAMHPAMMLRGVSARFTDPETGARIYPQSHPQQLGDYVMAATRAGLRFEHMSEHVVDDRLLTSSPRAARYRGWPMLVLMKLRPALGGATRLG